MGLDYDLSSASLARSPYANCGELRAELGGFTLSAERIGDIDGRMLLTYVAALPFSRFAVDLEGWEGRLPEPSEDVWAVEYGTASASEDGTVTLVFIRFYSRQEFLQISRTPRAFAHQTAWNALASVARPKGSSWEPSPNRRELCERCVLKDPTWSDCSPGMSADAVVRLLHISLMSFLESPGLRREEWERARSVLALDRPALDELWTTRWRGVGSDLATRFIAVVLCEHEHTPFSGLELECIIDVLTWLRLHAAQAVARIETEDERIDGILDLEQLDTLRRMFVIARRHGLELTIG